jgi:2-polyprenyl-6-methoxyphenol hydroxylase-like FAD-dependent oxidoreductase
MLMSRRSTVHWVLQRAVLAEPRVGLRCGVRVVASLANAGHPRHVTGVHTDECEVAADLVVDAAGRRSLCSPARPARVADSR